MNECLCVELVLQPPVQADWSTAPHSQPIMQMSLLICKGFSYTHLNSKHMFTLYSYQTVHLPVTSYCFSRYWNILSYPRPPSRPFLPPAINFYRSSIWKLEQPGVDIFTRQVSSGGGPDVRIGPHPAASLTDYPHPALIQPPNVLHCLSKKTGAGKASP